MDGCRSGLHNSNMPTANRLPTYALYGETGLRADIGWLHCESIAERSRLHDWEIRAHRHEALFQLLVIRSGACAATLDGRQLALRGPCIVAVPALVVHGFHFSPDVEGVVVTVLEQRMQRLLADEPALRQRALRLHGQAVPRAAGAELHRAVQELLREYRGDAAWRGLGLDAALLRLLLQVGRVHADDEADTADGGGGRALDQVRRFRADIDQRFRLQPSMADCAVQLGISPTQLNRLCRQVLGHSALGVLHARLLLEAQRELAYTSMSVKQIAFGLGFADAGYFTRFFQRLTRQPPSAWRAAAAQRHPAPARG